jgi:hypothetical protein
MLKTMFGSLHLGLNNSSSCDILQYYNDVFIKNIDNLLEEFRDSFELKNIKKRKLSLPDNMNYYQFEKESAFSNETNLYEPLKKTIFCNDNLSFSSGRFMGNKLTSQSPLCSPHVSKSSMSATGLSRTPRTSRVINSYLEMEKSSTPQQGSKGNTFRDKILGKLSSGKFSKFNLSK